MDNVIWEAGKDGAMIIAALIMVVQFIKKGLEWMEANTEKYPFLKKFSKWWAHGKGPIVITFILAFLTVATQALSDGQLTADELPLLWEALGLGAISPFIWWVIRRFAFTKK